MIKQTLLLVLFSCFSLVSYAAPAETTKINHVIYITLDGVRWQDIIKDKVLFPKLWSRYAGQMTVYGNTDGMRPMEVASIPISLPSYQSQMTGAVQPCKDNKCGRVKVKTMPEHLLSSLSLHKQDVAVFSGWPEVGHALESKPGSVYSNVGNLPVVDPVTGMPDSVMQEINQLQTLKNHVYGNRLDEYTFKQAMHYFVKYKPVFLWISLVNGDNEAHLGNLDKYHNMLAQYDNYLDELFATLRQMGLDHNTLVIVTTDHGRGNGGNWTTHGGEYPEAKRTWAFVMNGKLVPAAIKDNKKQYNTLSIRPTIERALGVS